MKTVTVCLAAFLGFCTAFPAQDPVIQKYDRQRFHHIQGPDGRLHIVDLWLKSSDVQEAARYTPDTQNVYHLFTRANPIVSQPLMLDDERLLGSTNFDPRKRTAVLVHGWLDSVLGDFNTVLVPAILEAGDVNVVVADWNAGAGHSSYLIAVLNTLTSGESVARFITWLNRVTGATASQYHIIGHSLGGHQSGIIGRNVEGDVSYITSVDPAFPGWITNNNKFRADDGAYTEVIHTNVGLLGYLAPLGQVDFYPNGGIDMPGCGNMDCDHDRGFYYLAESFRSGGFTGRQCLSFLTALAGSCQLTGRLQMGGLTPKTGSTGVYYVETNAAPPFSRD